MSSSTPPTPPPTSWVRVAQGTTIFLSAFLSGANLADSFLLIPRILESPVPLMVRQWQRAFNQTRVFFPVLLEPCAALFYLLAWHFRGATPSSLQGRLPLLTRSKLYVAAGLLCQVVGPYTVVVVAPTNRRIKRKVEQTEGMALTEEVVEKEDAREESARWLVDHWGMLNLPRGIMIGLAGVLGLVATFE